MARNGVPGETLQALRFLLAPASPSSDPSSFASPGSPQLEAELAAMLVHACKQELASLGRWPAIEGCRRVRCAREFRPVLVCACKQQLASLGMWPAIEGSRRVRAAWLNGLLAYWASSHSVRTNA